MKSEKHIINSEYSAVTDLINRLREQHMYSHLADRVKGEIEICLVEALNNVVRHSFKEVSGNSIEVYVTLSDSEIEIKIVEDGIPRPPMNKPTLDFDPEDIDNIPEGGMGLYIIDQLMTETEYTSENNVNTFLMKKKLT